MVRLCSSWCEARREEVLMTGGCASMTGPERGASEPAPPLRRRRPAGLPHRITNSSQVFEWLLVKDITSSLAKALPGSLLPDTPSNPPELPQARAPHTHPTTPPPSPPPRPPHRRSHPHQLLRAHYGRPPPTPPTRTSTTHPGSHPLPDDHHPPRIPDVHHPPLYPPLARRRPRSTGDRRFHKTWPPSGHVSSHPP